ncbi:MAG: glycogen synthase GlgA [Elusimicrobia bacterium]|jgi:starch synthase|nr:glycogen synthase GlgA [Elusimicrobiota bacterium]
MRILFTASEAVPFIKTGGLGDVVGALSVALKSAGHDVRLVLPYYRGISSDFPPLTLLPFSLRVPLGDGAVLVRVYEATFSARYRVYLVDSPDHFDRDGVYGEPGVSEFFDNDNRFIVLSRATLEIAKTVGFRPDIIHAHDWQTGLVPALLKTVYRDDPFFLPTASVFSIHNIAYQGIYPKQTLLKAGLGWPEFTPDKIEFYDQVNFLKAGIAYAHLVSTVSPSYAAETQRGEFGVGLDGFLRTRSSEYFGVLNGLDTRYWNPRQDPFLLRRYSPKTLSGRVACREDLQRGSGLDVDPKAPLFGMVSRLDPQKGIDILLAILEDFLSDGCQAVFLGQGNPGYQASLLTLQRKYPGRVSVSTDFNEPLAHKIYGGADIFLMPSRFEPCGLGQMIALRYGAVPVVNPTGGLLDTVAPVSEDGAKGVGFVADRVETGSYRSALQTAVRFLRTNPQGWRALVRRGMELSFDWKESVRHYVDLYRLAQSKKRASQAEASKKSSF